MIGIEALEADADVVPVGSESSEYAMPMQQPITKHSGNACHVSFVRTEDILVSETDESSRARP